MSKGNRLRSRPEHRPNIVAKRFAAQYRTALANTVDVPLFAPEEEDPPAPPTRPCGGVEYCVTASGQRAKRPHKKCE